VKGVTGRRMSLGRRVLFDAAGLGVFLLCAFPVYWMISTSFLTRREIRAPEPTWHPLSGTLDNYRRLFDDGEFLTALKMSLLVTVATVGVALLFAFLAAVALTRFRFRAARGSSSRCW
jgi:N,N'-diacetylchitobiose transport system permease protein